MPKQMEESSPKSEPQTAEGNPTREEIELRAHQIYIERGGADGQDMEDWLQAERELSEERGKTRPGQMRLQSKFAQRSATRARESGTYQNGYITLPVLLISRAQPSS